MMHSTSSESSVHGPLINSASTSTPSSSSTFSFTGNPILSSTSLSNLSSTSDDLPLPSFLITPDGSVDDCQPTPATSAPHLSDLQLPSVLLNSTFFPSFAASYFHLSWQHTLYHLTNYPSPTPDEVESVSTPVLTFIKGRRGGDRACYAGYVYTFDRKAKSDDAPYWKCSKSWADYTPRCPGRLYTISKESVKRWTPHSHDTSLHDVKSYVQLPSTTLNTTPPLIQLPMLCVIPWKLFL